MSLFFDILLICQKWVSVFKDGNWQLVAENIVIVNVYMALQALGLGV